MVKNKSKDEQLAEIREKILGLKKSPLYKYRTSNEYLPVSGEGDANARIVFVGEAPGRNEAKTGKPFCGAAGKILDTLLAEVKLNRTSVFITNIVKDRPPENRDPTPEEIRVYGPLLDQQIEIIQPKVVVALGRYAMDYIMKKFDLEKEIQPISKAHGKVHKTKTTYGAVDVVTLYHPCVAIYSRKKLPILLEDFKILKAYRE